MECELVYSPHDLMSQLTTLKSVGVDGITVNICWGIVEANTPRDYNWEGYNQLFSIIRQSGFNKMQVLMSFHECVGDDAHIPLPKWIKEIGEKNPDIYFTDGQGTRNTETLTWGIDEERVLGDRTAVEVYTDYMRSFRDEFDELFQDRSISKVEVGLGACGELRYPPSLSGEFHLQCYDKYLRKSLEKAAETAQDSSWGTPPDCSTFFCDDHDYDSPRGTFFLKWYSQYLIDHGVRVLKMAVPLFKPARTYVKLAGNATDNRAAERAAGFYDGYKPIAIMLRRHDAHLNFTCVEADEFVCKVENAGWVSGIAVSGQNAFPCYDRQGYGKILEVAKPRNDVFGRCICSFTYRGLDQTLLEQRNLREFELFVKKMHGTYPISVGLICVVTLRAYALSSVFIKPCGSLTNLLICSTGTIKKYEDFIVDDPVALRTRAGLKKSERV
ncbi:putative beta-amylase [Helianthus annuus]|nr:putative beta-amylase [Helianthus annuus]